MTPQEILNNSSHRPIPLPEDQWMIYQEWKEVVFLHWPVQPELLHHFLPEGLDLQSYKGNGWVSLVVFRLNNLRPRYLPALPAVSDSNEINIRTYVTCKGKPGIYFLNMELGKTFTKLIAKTFTGLPYRTSSIEHQEGYYISRNNDQNDELNLQYQAQEKILDKTELDKWLTERYALFQDHGQNTIIEYEVHHAEWPLHDVFIQENQLKYDRFSSLIHKEPQCMHYSPGVEVLTWGRKNHRIR